MGGRSEDRPPFLPSVDCPYLEALTDPQRAAPYLGVVSMYALMNAAPTCGTIEFPIPRIVSALDAASLVRPSASRKGIPVTRGAMPG